MMKKIVLLITLIISILLFGIISIDERQNVVVTNLVSKNKYTLTPGLHFVWPGIEQVNYIFMNQRDAEFTTMLTFDNNTNVEVSSVVLWKVVNPLVYFEQNSKLQITGFNKVLAQNVLQIVMTRAKSTNLSTFNQLNNLLSDELPLKDLGIIITSIAPNELRIVTPVSVAAPVKKIEASEAIKIDQPRIVQIPIESAYYQAQMIKTQAEIQQANMLQQLEEKDPKFYSYFRKLQIYKNSAKSKQDMPPLEDLYK